MATKLLQFDIAIGPRETGFEIPSWRTCDLSFPEGFKQFREALGSALSNAVNATNVARSAIASASEDQQSVKTLINKALAQNPDPNTPNTVDQLSEDLGLLGPTTDKEELERRVADLLDLNVVNGVLFAPGSEDLGPLRKLFQSLELTGDCSLPSMTGKMTVVMAQNVVSESAVRNSCGQDIVEYTVTEQKIGQDISVAKASDVAGIDKSEVLIRVYWYDEVSSDRATLSRLKALGIQGDDLTTAVMAPAESGRTRSEIVDTSALTKLNALLSSSEICTMMQRSGGGSVNLEPEPEDITKTIRDALNKYSGMSRVRGGTDEEDIEPDPETEVSPAGRVGDVGLTLLSVVDIARSIGIVRDDDGNLPVDTGEMNQQCLEISIVLNEIVSVLSTFMLRVSGMTSELNASLGLGQHQLTTSLGFTSCLGSINLGADIGINIAGLMPFSIEAYLVSLTAAITAITTAVLALREFTCIPQGFVQLVFGGICGYKPFEFGICPPDLQELLSKISLMLGLINVLIGTITKSLQSFKIEADAMLSISLDLKFFSQCALAVIPVATGLGLAGAPELGAATVSAGISTDGEGAEAIISTEEE